MRYFWLLTLLALSACTDATTASWGALGDPAEVICYSGGKEIYRGKSTGKVATTSQSDGWEFKEAGTGNFIRVSGDCIVRN